MPPAADDVETLVVFAPNWVGDAVMATPAWRALRTRFAGARVLAVCRPPVDAVLAGTGLFDAVVPMRKSVRGALEAAAALRSERPDFAVLFPNSSRAALVATLGGCRRTLGFARDGRGRLLSDPVPAGDTTTPSPTLLNYNRTAAAAGCGEAGVRTELAVSINDERQFAVTLDRHPHLQDGFVALNPGGAFGAAKHWPAGHFASLARRLAATGRGVLVLCGPAERAIAAEIAAVADDRRVVSLHDFPPSIGLTKAAVRAADLLVTTDSGPRHFAAPFEVPCVTLFGPTHIPWSETFHPAARHVQLPVDCGPCQQRTCPLGHHRCMTDLTPDRIFAEAMRALHAAPVRLAA